MKTTVKVDENLCIGSGSCIVLASEFFELDDEGKAQITQGKIKGKEVTLDINSKDRKKLLDAARACPTQAISIVDENGKKIYP